MNNYLYAIGVALCLQFLFLNTEVTSDSVLLNQPYFNFSIGGYKYSYPLFGHPPGPVYMELPTGAKIPLRLTKSYTGVLEYGFYADGTEITVPYAELYKTLAPTPKPKAIKLTHPIISKTYSNGATFFYGWSDGEYRSLPTTYTIGSTTYTLTGKTGNVYVSGPHGEHYDIIPTQKGADIAYEVQIGGENINLSLGSEMSSSVME